MPNVCAAMYSKANYVFNANRSLISNLSDFTTQIIFMRRLV